MTPVVKLLAHSTPIRAKHHIPSVHGTRGLRENEFEAWPPRLGIVHFHLHYFETKVVGVDDVIIHSWWWLWLVLTHISHTMLPFFPGLVVKENGWLWASCFYLKGFGLQHMWALQNQSFLLDKKRNRKSCSKLKAIFFSTYSKVVTLREIDRKSTFISLNWCHVRRVDSRQPSYGVALITSAEDVVSFPNKLARTVFGKSVPVSSCADSWTSLSDLRFEERGPSTQVLRLEVKWICEAKSELQGCPLSCWCWFASGWVCELTQCMKHTVQTTRYL